MGRVCGDVNALGKEAVDWMVVRMQPERENNGKADVAWSRRGLSEHE